MDLSFFKKNTAANSLLFLLIISFSTAGISFITTVKLANTLGKDIFGNFSYAIAVGMFVTTFIWFGFDRTLVKHLIQVPAKYDKIVISSLFIRGVLCLIALVLIVAGVFWGIISLSCGSYVIIFSLSLLSLDLQAVFDSKMLMARHALYNFAQKGLYLTLIWICLLLFPNYLNIGYVGFSMLAGVILFLFLQFLWVKKVINFSDIPPISLVSDLIKSDWSIWIAVMANLSFAYITQIMLKNHCGSAELGIYSAAWQIVIVSTLFLVQIARIGLPKMAKYCMDDISKKQRIIFLVKYISLLLVVMLAISFPAFLFSERIIGFLYSSQYLPAVSIMKIFAIYIIFFAFGVVSSQYLISNGKNRSYLTIVLLCGGLNIVLNLMLIPHYKGLGAALAMTISHAVAMLSYFVMTVIHFCYRIEKVNTQLYSPETDLMV